MPPAPRFDRRPWRQLLLNRSEDRCLGGSTAWKAGARAVPIQPTGSPGPAGCRTALVGVEDSFSRSFSRDCGVRGNAEQYQAGHIGVVLAAASVITRRPSVAADQDHRPLLVAARAASRPHRRQATSSDFWTAVTVSSPCPEVHDAVRIRSIDERAGPTAMFRAGPVCAPGAGRQTAAPRATAAVGSSETTSHTCFGFEERPHLCVLGDGVWRVPPLFHRRASQGRRGGPCPWRLGRWSSPETGSPTTASSCSVSWNGSSRKTSRDGPAIRHRLAAIHNPSAPKPIWLW